MVWQEQFLNDYQLSPSQIRQFETLLSFLDEKRDRNYTAVIEPARMIDIHFRDSLDLLQFDEVSSAARTVDIGSGAGFPGVPLAIAKPDGHFELIESNAGKCAFLESIVEAVGLTNVSVIDSRAEEVGRSALRESFDLALARAVAPLAVVLEYALPLLSIGGSAALQRGARENGDHASASRIAPLLGGRLNRIEPVVPYQGARNLNVWIFDKSDKTPGRFPRRIGIPKKRPLSAG